MTYYRFVTRLTRQVPLTGATSGAGTAYPPVAPEFNPGFK